MQIPILQKPELGPYPVNLYPSQAAHRDLKFPGLMGTPGSSLFYEPTAWGFPVRQLHPTDNHLYAVIGNRVYRIDKNANGTLLTGTLSTTSGPVCMEDDGTNLMIVDPGVAGYTVTLSDGDVTAISDPDFPTPSFLTWQDGYFIVPEQNSGRFFISGLYDPTSWDALDYATAEGRPDDILANYMDHRELWKFGSDSIQVYYNAGYSDFPFEHRTFIEQGIGAPHSFAAWGGIKYFLNKHGVVMAISGYSPQPISPKYVAAEIAGLSTFSDAIGFIYTQEGHTFYVLTFPTGDVTWVYDISTQSGHKRKSWPLHNDGTEGRWRANCYAYFDNKHIVGDWQYGQLYELDLDTYTDNGETIRRYVDFPAIGDGDKKIRHNKLKVDFEMGVGLTTGQGDDPQAMLQWSDDGGKTWGNEIWVTMGAMGKYKASAIWRRLGASKRRIYRLGVSDPVKCVITGAFLN